MINRKKIIKYQFDLIKTLSYLLEIELSGGNIELAITPDTSLLIKDVSNPTEKFDNSFAGCSGERYREFDKLIQNHLL